jgi:hypothetical protein
MTSLLEKAKKDVSEMMMTNMRVIDAMDQRCKIL